MARDLPVKDFRDLPVIYRTKKAFERGTQNARTKGGKLYQSKSTKGGNG